MADRISRSPLDSLDLLDPGIDRGTERDLSKSDDAAADAGPAADVGHERWMMLALAQADMAAREKEVPVGCVLVDEAGQLLGAGHNARETLRDPTAHAEIIA